MNMEGIEETMENQSGENGLVEQQREDVDVQVNGLPFSCVKIPKKAGIDQNSAEANDDDFFWLFESEQEVPTMQSLANCIKPEMIRRHGTFPEYLEHVPDPRSTRSMAGLAGASQETSTSRPRRQPRRTTEPTTFPRRSSMGSETPRPPSTVAPSATVSAIMEHLRSLPPHILNAIATAGHQPSVTMLLTIIQQQQKQQQQLLIQQQQYQLMQQQRQQQQRQQQLLTPQQISLQHRLALLQSQLQHPMQQFTSPYNNNLQQPSKPHPPRRIPNIPTPSSSSSSTSALDLSNQFSRICHNDSSIPFPHQSQQQPPTSLPSSSSSSFLFPTSSLYGELQTHLTTMRSGVPDSSRSGTSTPRQASQPQPPTRDRSFNHHNHLPHHLDSRATNANCNPVQTRAQQDHQQQQPLFNPQSASELLQATQTLDRRIPTSYQPDRSKGMTTNMFIPNPQQLSEKISIAAETILKQVAMMQQSDDLTTRLALHPSSPPNLLKQLNETLTSQVADCLLHVTPNQFIKAHQQRQLHCYSLPHGP